MKRNSIFIIVSSIVYLFWFIFNIYAVASLEWWGGWTLFLVVILPLIITGFIAGAIFLFKKSSELDHIENIFKKKKVLNSSTVGEWCKERILEKGDNLVIDNSIMKQSGRKGERTPVAYITGKGSALYLNYHIFVNLVEPEDYHTIIERKRNLTETQIQKYVDDLSYAPLPKKKRIVRTIGADGSRNEVEEEDTVEDEQLLDKFVKKEDREKNK